MSLLGLAVMLSWCGFAPSGRAQTLPTIALQPVSQTNLAGSDVVFSVAVTGTGPFAYRWRFNGTALPGNPITTVAGNTNASLSNPQAVALDSAGNLYIADTGNNRVRKVDTNGLVTTVAGNGSPAFAGDGGAATNASLNGPLGVAVDAAGNLYIADTANHRVRKVDSYGIIRTLAGNGNATYGGDGGAATNASLNSPHGVALDAAANLYVADRANQRIRRVGLNGIITTVAGNGSPGSTYGGNGIPATSASLYNPTGIALDPAGNLFIADWFNNVIRKVDLNGIITTVAGNGANWFGGDGGAATAASLNNPLGVAADGAGNLYIADQSNNRIRKVDAGGIITTVAGNGIGAYAGDGGTATAASLYNPTGVALDPAGNLYIADSYNQCIRKVQFAGQPALALTHVSPDNAGDYSVVVTGRYGSVTSAVATLTVVLPPAVVVQPGDQWVPAGNDATLSVVASGTPPLYYSWYFNGSDLLQEGTNASLLVSGFSDGNAGSYSVVVTNAYGSVTSSNAVLNLLDVASAVNATQLTWSIDGDAPWFFETAFSHDGIAALQSGALTNGQQSVLETFVSGPGTLTFWWSADTASTNDYLAFSLNGVEQARRSGKASWQAQTYYLEPGFQVLRWTYAKTDDAVSGQDAGWLDQVSFVAGGTAPQVRLNPTNQVALAGWNVTFQAGAVGTPPLHYQWQFNGANLEGMTSNVLVLTNLQFSQQGNYSLVVSNDFGVTNTAVASLSVPDITDATNLMWSAAGNLPWFLEANNVHDGVAGMQSGRISGGQSSTLQATVGGPGTLSFWWMVSSETNNDYVSFSVDGVEQARISGNVPWRQTTCYLAAATHTLTWSYSKNPTVNYGADAAYLDQVAYTVGGTPAFIGTGPASQTAALGSNATFSVVAQGTPPFGYQWFFNDHPIPDATNRVLSLSNVQASDVGTYGVVAANAYGSSTNASASLSLLSVYTWGAGQTNGPSPNFGQSSVPTNLTDITALAAGGFHSLALRANGRVVPWGWNNSGQTNVPTTLTNAAAVAAGYYHSLALRSNGTLVPWGSGSAGLYPPPTSATNVGAIAAGWYHNLALRSNGTVVAWGAGATQGSWPYFGQSMVPTNLAGVAAIAAGGYHSLALRSNGTVVAWGWNACGQTNVPAGLNNVVAIAAGGSNSVVLKNDGTLVAWGDNTYGQTSIPAGLSNVVAIAAGAAHTLALQSDGSVLAWGLNANGQTNIPSNLHQVVAIAAGAYHNLALVNTGPVTFLAGPSSQTAYQDSEVTFAAPALGTAPLSYQWLRNGANLEGATNAVLSRAGVQFADAGKYQLVVSNSYGAVTSAVAVLTVLEKAPLFTAQPTNQWVLQNSNVTLSASAAGLPPLGYQWQLNGVNILGATNATLVLTNAQLANEGTYCLVASNAYGTATSSNLFLNVVDVPEALGPTDLVWLNPSGWYAQSATTHDGFAGAAVGPLAYGKQAMLQTSVTGPGTLSFWWADSLNVTLTFALDGLSKASWQQYYAANWGTYTFYVPAGIHALTWTAANQYSSSYNGMAFLDQVTFAPGATAPFITSQPASQTNTAGNSVTFTVGATGTPPLSYQWYFNGAAISGAGGSSLTVPNIQATNTGLYNAVVTSSYGTAVSSNALLSVTPAAPTLTAQPADLQVMEGGQATFSSAAVGSSPLSYQWLFNGAPLAGATASSLSLSNVQVADAGTYALVVSNALGSATSSNALLRIYTAAELGASVGGAGIAWSTTNVPWFPQTNTTHDGVSAAQSGAIAGGQLSTLQGVVTGPATVTYWWKVNCDSFWVNLAFVLNGTVQNAIAGNVDWQAATNYIGAGSQVLQWNLYPTYGFYAGGTGWLDQVQVIPGGTGASITAHPVSAANSAGNSVSFSVAGTGTPPLRYQWQFNGVDLPGATNATLNVVNVQAENAGAYGVVVTNDYGFAVSSNASLVVNPSAPVITSQPVSQSRTPNSSVSFKVSAKGSSPVSCQWQWNGTPLPGETNTTLSFASLQPGNAGSYSAVLTNAYGAVTSAVAVLEVNPTAVLEYWPGGYASYATPFGLSNIIAVAAGSSHTAALREDGTVAAWGGGIYGQTNVPPGLSNVIALAAGDNHTVALRADGSVVAWGDNTYGQQAVPAGLSNVVAIAAGASYTLALKDDGTVVGWGNNNSGQLNIPAGLSGVVAIAAGVYNGLAVKADGTVVQWGNGPTWQHNGVNTQLTVAVGLSNVVAVGAGGFSAWSLHNDGSVLGWGWSGYYNYGGVAALSVAGTGSPSYDYVLGLTYNGTLVTTWFGGYSYTPYIAASPTNIIGVSAGYRHAALLINDGSPRVVGRAPDQGVYTGATAILPSGIVGAAPMTYQWQFNGTNLAGATNAFLVLSNVPLSAVGSYRCIASNNQGSVTNGSATLSVSRTAPRFGSGAPLSSDGFALLLGALSGHGPVVIQSSSNLVDWVPVCTNAPTLGQLQFVDPGATNQPCLFYRAVEQ